MVDTEKQTEHNHKKEKQKMALKKYWHLERIRK